MVPRIIHILYMFNLCNWMIDNLNVWILFHQLKQTERFSREFQQTLKTIPTHYTSLFSPTATGLQTPQHSDQKGIGRRGRTRNNFPLNLSLAVRVVLSTFWPDLRVVRVFIEVKASSSCQAGHELNRDSHSATKQDLSLTNRKVSRHHCCQWR